MLIELYVGLALVLVIIWYYAIVRKDMNNMENLPGPKPNFLFGNTLDFITVDTDEFLQVLMRYVKNYGKLIKVKSGPFKPGVVVTDRDFMEYVLTSNRLIDKARDYIYFHNWLGTGLLTSTGKKWRQRRKMITPSYHFSILEQFTDTFEKCGNVLVEKLNKYAGEKSVDIYPLITLCTLDVICEASMGTSVNAQMNEDSEYVQKVKYMCSLPITRSFSATSDILYFLTPTYYREKNALKVIHSYTDSVINARIKERNTQKIANGVKDDGSEFGIKKRLAFLDMLLEGTIDGKPLSRQDLREEVDTFMFEGHDTTSSAITFALYCLANHPEVQEKVLEEQRGIFGNLKNVTVTNKELAEMKYMELVLKETLRLYPSVPLYGREILQDFQYGDNTFKKGTSILLLVFAMQRHPDYFPDPDKFIPERFETPDNISTFSYVPFSAGPRNCIGQKFAMLEMKSTVSKVIRNFELLPAKPHHELRLAPETILISKNGVRIAIKKRLNFN